jgi:hypothetical protein
VRAFGALPADHPLIGRTCEACKQPFAEGDVTTILPLGPGSDPDERRRRDQGRAYTSAGLPLHWECSTKDER